MPNTNEQRGEGAKAPDILAQAHAIVTAGRHQYDPENGERNLENIAEFWTTYIRQHYPGTLVEILPTDVAMMMVLLKVARVIGNVFHEDNYVDIAGYAALAAEEVDGN